MAGGSPKTVGVTNPLKIFSNIFISFIGAGVLGLPYAFKEAGVMEGIIVMTVVAIFSCKAMLMVIECKYEVLRLRSKRRYERYSSTKHSTNNGELTEVKMPLVYGESDSEEEEAFWRDDEFLSYGDIGYYALGNTGRSLVDFAIIVSQVGFCCAYLIFITENLASYIPSVAKTQWLVIILPPLFLISLLRQLDRLAFFSLFAQLTNIFAFTVVFWFDFQHYHTVRFRPREFSLKGFPLYFAIAIYCYEGAGMILSLEHSLAPQLRPKFKNYFLFTMVIVTSLYVTFGASGYLSFGPATKEIITMNLPHSGDLDFAVLVKLCLSLALFCTYPIMLFPVVQLLETRCTPTMSPTQQVWLQNMYRVVLVSITGVIVVVVPNFAHLMALVGATCCTLLAFILPALFHIMVFKHIQTFKRCLLNLLIILIGLSGLVIGTMDAVNRMGEGSPDLDRGAVEFSLVHSTTPMSNTSAQRHFFVGSGNSSNVSKYAVPNLSNLSLPNQSFSVENEKGNAAQNAYFATEASVYNSKVNPVLPEPKKEENIVDSKNVITNDSGEGAISSKEDNAHEENSEIITGNDSGDGAISSKEDNAHKEEDNKTNNENEVQSENQTLQGHQNLPNIEDKENEDKVKSIIENSQTLKDELSKPSEENPPTSVPGYVDSLSENASKQLSNTEEVSPVEKIDEISATSNAGQLLDSKSPTTMEDSSKLFDNKPPTTMEDSSKLLDNKPTIMEDSSKLQTKKDTETVSAGSNKENSLKVDVNLAGVSDSKRKSSDSRTLGVHS